MDNLVELYCHIDDFCKAYTAEQQQKMLKLSKPPTIPSTGFLDEAR